MNEYFLVFSIRKFFMNKCIWYLVKFTIRCNSDGVKPIYYIGPNILSFLLEQKHFWKSVTFEIFAMKATFFIMAPYSLIIALNILVTESPRTLSCTQNPKNSAWLTWKCKETINKTKRTNFHGCCQPDAGVIMA